MLKSAIHIHSTYSDGEFTLAELREIYMATGYDFICMTDHAEFFTEAQVSAYRNECEILSDERFNLFAGLEFECDQRMHILGLGVTSLVNTTNPQEVIEHIRNQNGISVIAHPLDSMFNWIETFEVLPDGIETWNSKYDGRFAPRPATFELLNRLQKRKPEMRAYYGQDMHWKKQFRGLSYALDCQTPRLQSVLQAYRQGNYVAQKNELELPSNGQLTEELKIAFKKLNSQYHTRRRLMKNVKKTIDRFGITIPEVLKSQLRRVF
jgi:hypothetical protein